jgi:hypothetical protein
MRNVLDKHCRGNQNTHFVFSNFFFLENRAVYEEMWEKKPVERGRPQMTIWHMRIACWITKATYTLTICNSYFFSTTIMVVITCLKFTFICTLPVFFNNAIRL